MLRHFNT